MLGFCEADVWRCSKFLKIFKVSRALRVKAVKAIKGKKDLNYDNNKGFYSCSHSHDSVYALDSSWMLSTSRAEACLPIVVDLAPTGRKSGIIAWQMALEQVFSVAAACIIGVPGQHCMTIQWKGTKYKSLLDTSGNLQVS